MKLLLFQHSPGALTKASAHERIRHLYIHIPFCPSKCEYCAFVTHIGSLRLAPSYLEAVVRECDGVDGNERAGTLETVYFGGGTPTMLSAQELGTILGHVDRRLGMTAFSEITLEAHPSTVSRRSLTEYRAAGFNRISFGAESFASSELRAVGRQYDATRLSQVVRDASLARFQSIALDLIFGLPGQTTASWEQSLRAAVALDIGHISAYPLSLEPRSILSLKASRGGVWLPADEQVSDMYEIACAVLGEAGFEHYEVANWARTGQRSRHNQAYWQNREVLGIGVGAHSYVKPFRTENLRHTKPYIDAVLQGRPTVLHRDRIDPEIEIAETMMLGLRLLVDGIDLASTSSRLGVNLRQRYSKQIEELNHLHLLLDTGSHLRIPESAVPVANSIWAYFV